MKKNLYTSSLLAACILFSTCLLAQRNPEPIWPRSPSGNYRCFTDEVDKWRRQQSGSTGNNSFEKWIGKKIKETNDQPVAQRSTPIIFTIPVIFHIIHSGEAAGTGSNIGASYIAAQIQQLNNDFRRIAGTSGYNTSASGADVQIQFAAATLDVNNNALAEPGIQRINKAAFGATNPPFAINYIENTIKPNSIWDATKYLNIWVLHMNVALGYAQFPDAPNELGVGINNVANTDGVVVLYTTVGSSLQKFPGGFPYDEGRTLTHEVGHWIGLRHIWGDGNCATDDFVFDTPRANGPNFGCVAPTTNSCNDITYGAPTDPNDMPKNYMDYSDDGCMNIFTIGQRNRMRVVMGETGAGAPRRAVLRLSDRSQTVPIVAFTLTDTTVSEKTECMLNRSYTIPVRISRAPNATTTVSLAQTTGSLDGQDITISPASVEFSATDIADKYFYVTVNADAVMEGHEMGYFNLNVSGSNAAAAADSFELIIMNDDWPAFNGRRIPATLLSEDFEGVSSGAWITHDYVVGNNKWVVGGTNGNMNGTKSAYISSNNSGLQYDANSTSHSILYREVDASLYDSLMLSLWYVSLGEKDANGIYDYGKVVYSTDSITFHQLNGTTDLVDSTNMTFLFAQLPYFLWNRKFYIGFYWENDNIIGNDPPFAIDDINIYGRRWMPSMIHTSVDTTAGFDQKPVGPFQTVDFYDKVTGDILATIQDLSGFNWGCVKVEVDRAGTGAQWLTGDPQTSAQTKLFDKTYKVVPTNNNANAQYRITFYLTQAEIMGWQIASGAPFPAARMIKYSDRINNMTYTSNFAQNLITATSFMGGGDMSVSAQFNTGFSGFGFGFIPTALPVQIISFTARENNKTVDLVWKTENETNLSHYKVMRSRDGINYEAIGTVTARGTNGNISDYSLSDPQPFTGKNFYQLVSYDINGASKKSQVVQVDIRSAIIYTVSPNPFTDQIIVGQSNSLRQTLLIQLTDLQGRKVMMKQIKDLVGSATINVGGISRGVYLLKISNDEGTQVFKLVRE